MLCLSATCLAIALADKRGTLRFVERTSSYGLGSYVVLEDDKGLIEVADNMVEAQARVAQVRR